MVSSSFRNDFVIIVCCDSVHPPTPNHTSCRQVLHLFCRKLSRELSPVLSRMKSASRLVLHLFFSLQNLTLFPLAPHSACSLAARREVTRVPLHMPRLVLTALGSGAKALGARGRGRESARRHGLSSSCTTHSNRKNQPSPLHRRTRML